MPIDAVKSRQQVLSIGSKDSISFFECARGLHQAAGVRGFYAGLRKLAIIGEKFSDFSVASI